MTSACSTRWSVGSNFKLECQACRAAPCNTGLSRGSARLPNSGYYYVLEQRQWRHSGSTRMADGAGARAGSWTRVRERI